MDDTLLVYMIPDSCCQDSDPSDTTLGGLSLSIDIRYMVIWYIGAGSYKVSTVIAIVWLHRFIVLDHIQIMYTLMHLS